MKREAARLGCDTGPGAIPALFWYNLPVRNREPGEERKYEKRYAGESRLQRNNNPAEKSLGKVLRYDCLNSCNRRNKIKPLLQGCFGEVFLNPKEDIIERFHAATSVKLNRPDFSAGMNTLRGGFFPGASIRPPVMGCFVSRIVSMRKEYTQLLIMSILCVLLFVINLSIKLII